MEILKAFLGTLPEAVAIKLAKAVEVDRLGGGASLPHDLILDGLRPQLQHAHAERTPTPLRLFCVPFSDLLTSSPGKEKQKGVIARSTIQPLWRWLQQLVPDAFADFERNVRESVLTYRQSAMMEHCEIFWRAAAKAIRETLASDSGRKEARLALGGDSALADALEIATMISAGPQIVALQELLPTPAPTPNEEHLAAIRVICDQLSEAAEDAKPYVGVVAMRRMERPWEALRIPLILARQTQDTLISSTDMGLAGEILFSEIEARATAICASRPQAPFDPEALIGHLKFFARASNGIVKEIEMRRDGKWGQRLMKQRGAVGDAMDALMERAPRDILAAIASQKSGSYGGGPRVPDISRAPDVEKVARALAFARLIAGCRNIASAASFGAKLKDADEEISSALKSYNEGIVRELRTQEGERREIAELCFNVAAELTTILFSEEEGELLRRRGRAAIGVEAAA